MNKQSLQEAAKNSTGKLFSNHESVTNDAASAVPASKPVEKSGVKKVFSFRGPEEMVKAWRAYAAITGQKVDDLGTAALNEFLANHPLSDAEQQVFDHRMQS